MKKLILIIVAVVMSIAAFAQSPALIKDEGGYTNVRKGPGTDYAIVEKLKDGMPISYKRSSTSGWYKIYYIGGGNSDAFIGYVASSKVVVPKRQGAWKYVGQVKPEGGYTNIRKGAGSSYDIVGKVKDGSYILYSRSSNGWYKVYTQSGAFRGFMSASKINMTESPAF